MRPRSKKINKGQRVSVCRDIVRREAITRMLAKPALCVRYSCNGHTTHTPNQDLMPRWSWMQPER